MSTYPVPFINLEYIYYSLIRVFTGSFSGNIFILIYNKISYIAEWIVPYSVLISLLFLTGIIYCILRIAQIEKELILTNAPVATAGGQVDNKVNARWEKILAHIHSDNESDWRLAILEADMILQEMLISMGYHGESVGEQLRSVEKSDFQTLDYAWNAHKVRNKIAHEIDYAISNREARKTVLNYEKVFQEFKLI